MLKEEADRLIASVNMFSLKVYSFTRVLKENKKQNKQFLPEKQNFAQKFKV